MEAYKKKADIADLVDTETSKDDVEKSKPHPDIFDAALSKLHSVERNEVIVIGDTPWDAIAARRAGMKMIGVLCGGFPAGELRSNGCIAIYKDPADLLRRYAESPLAVKVERDVRSSYGSTLRRPTDFWGEESNRAKRFTPKPGPSIYGFSSFLFPNENPNPARRRRGAMRSPPRRLPNHIL